MTCLRQQEAYRTAGVGPTPAVPVGQLQMERESQENGVEELKSHETAQLVFTFSDLSTNLGTCETTEQKYH